MNRRGFFGWLTAAVGAMAGWKAETPRIVNFTFLVMYKAIKTTPVPPWRVVEDGCLATFLYSDGTEEDIRLPFLPTDAHVIAMCKHPQDVKRIIGIDEMSAERKPYRRRAWTEGLARCR